jgi:PAS domain-containing protein
LQTLVEATSGSARHFRQRPEDTAMSPASTATSDGALRAAVITEGRRQEALLTAEALQNAIFNSANFSSIATDARGVIQIFNVGAERMLGYTAAEVMNQITPADISDPQEVVARPRG